MILFLFLVFVTLIAKIILDMVKRPKNFPPGPMWKPFVGNQIELKKLTKELGGQHLALAKLAKDYNTNVLGVKLGNEYLITILSYSVVKEALQREELCGRPDNFFLRLRTFGTRLGIVCTDGDYWKIQRSFVMSHMKDLGFGKNTMDLMVKDELNEVLAVIEEKSQSNHVGQIARIMAPAVLNILWTLNTGKRIGRGDPRLQRFLDLLETRGRAFDITGGTLSRYPWLRFIMPEKIGYNLITKLNQQLREFFVEVIQDHYKTWTEGRDDDIMYKFITEMKKANGERTTFTEDQLITICLDFIFGGSTTTSDALDFSFMSMILYPDVQRKVQECLDKAFKPSEPISYSDKVRVPYVDAVLLEVQRIYNTVVWAGPRRALEETTLDGYTIPKNSTVFISLHSIRNEKEYWKDPEVFRAERHLDENGKLVVSPRILPFGLGKRRCLGEILARNVLFVFFAEIMRKYSVVVPKGGRAPSKIPDAGITIKPKPYDAQFVRRF